MQSETHHHVNRAFAVYLIGDSKWASSTPRNHYSFLSSRSEVPVDIGEFGMNHDVLGLHGRHFGAGRHVAQVYGAKAMK
jgi:hypothetical protein